VDDKDSFIKAYHDFRNSVDLTKSGVLPDLENLVWYILMGVPPVPADQESAEDAPTDAVDQRVSILKAVFVEANKDQSDELIDEGLRRYDQAGEMARLSSRKCSCRASGTNIGIPFLAFSFFSFPRIAGKWNWALRP